MSKGNEGQPRPQVNIRDIEGLTWSTKKKVVKEEASVVTRFSFEAEITSDQSATLHMLLKQGGPLTASFTSPQLLLDLQAKDADKKPEKE